VEFNLSGEYKGDMRITVPITGEIIRIDLEHPEFASGNPENAVRPLDFKKLLPDDFAWHAVEYDFINEVVEIEVLFARKTIVTKWRDETDEELLIRTAAVGHSVERIQVPAKTRKETHEELQIRQANTEKALDDIFNKKTIDELYQLSGEPRVKKPVGGPS